MKSPRIALLLILSALLTNFSFSDLTAQLSEGGQPFSIDRSELKGVASLPTLKLEKLDRERLLREDEEAPRPVRYSVFSEMSVDIRQEGLITEIPEENGRTWRYRFKGENATSIQLSFGKFMIPPGSQLFVYTSDYSVIYGAFTVRNNNAGNTFTIADLPGNELILEYFEPYGAVFEGELEVDAVGQGYRNLEDAFSSEDENGFINVNCPEGKEWQNEKHSVCRFTFQKGGSGYFCSGALINNVNNDGTPFFLTAHHCLSSEASANSVVAYFNYELIGCSGDRKPDQTLSGSNLRTTGFESDYTLLEFYEMPPVSYQPYYAGWDASGDSSDITVGIHHPGGQVKKISIDNDPSVSYPLDINWENNVTTPPNTHWQVVFDKGQTAGGSSGSPLFSQEGRIIGQLHGGNEVFKYYGEIDYSWVNADEDQDSTLGQFLDPENTGTLIMDAYYPPEVKPDPQFFPEFATVCADAPVKLIGFSAFETDSWAWSFSPDDVIFESGSTAASQEPVVRFPSSVDYDISLEATNTNGSIEYDFPSTVTAGDQIVLQIAPLTVTDSCLCNVDSLLFEARGAAEFVWSLDSTLNDFYSIENDSLNISTLRSLMRPDTAVNLLLNLRGTHGTCIDSIPYALPLFLPENDSIYRAAELFEGESELFSNKCADKEENEPAPPAGACISQLSWCDEFGTGEDIVGPSIWFFFIPDSSADYQFSSIGMDNQIALYDAESSIALLNGDYELLAANDDYSGFDFNPRISRIGLEEGKRYYVQADGSFGNAEGSFRMNIQQLPAVGIGPDKHASGLQLYPQPAVNELFIRQTGEWSQGPVILEIYNASGRIVHRVESEHAFSDELRIPLAGFTGGIYLLRLTNGGEIITGRFIKQ